MREQPFLDQILDAAGHKWRAAVLILRRQFLPEPCHGAIEVMQGRRLRQGLLDTSNTASGVWADTAYRSAANETFLTKNGFASHIHRKKPKGRAMHETLARRIFTSQAWSVQPCVRPHMMVSPSRADLGRP
jgi:hypothetical protein